MKINLREKIEKGKVVMDQIHTLTKENPEFDVTVDEAATKLGMDTEGLAAVQTAALINGGVREIAAFMQIGIVLGMAYERKCRQEGTTTEDRREPREAADIAEGLVDPETGNVKAAGN